MGVPHATIATLAPDDPEPARTSYPHADSVLKTIVGRCKEIESGGRMIDQILTNSILPVMSREFLTRMMEERPIQKVHIDVVDNEFTYAFD